MLFDNSVSLEQTGTPLVHFSVTHGKIGFTRGFRVSENPAIFKY